MHFGHVQPHALPGVAVNGEAALVNVKQHPAVFVLLLRAPAGSEAHGPRVAAPGPGAFGAFGVGAAVSIGRGAGHGGAGARDAEGCAGGVCSRAQRGDQRPAGAAFSMPLAAAGRTKGERRPELCLRAVPEISETAHTTGKWISRGAVAKAVGLCRVPTSLSAPHCARTEPTPNQGIAHQLPALQLPSKATWILPQSFTPT